MYSFDKPLYAIAGLDDEFQLGALSRSLDAELREGVIGSILWANATSRRIPATLEWTAEAAENMNCLRITKLLLVVVFTLQIPSLAQEPSSGAKAILWIDPGDIRSRNLQWGVGGKEHQPQLPLEFLQEDRHGTSPKFDVRDADGKKWSAKLGLEAKPEIVAARLMWAVGYGANENYFFAVVHVNNMPPVLNRGQPLAGHDGDVPNVRLQRNSEKLKRIGNWNWRHNPLYGTREFNGLRIMMGLIANWDLKDDNNAVLKAEHAPDPNMFEVSDVGTSFGTPGKSYTDGVSKGNLSVYRRTKLIKRVHKDYIDLNFPKRPPLLELLEFEWGFFFHQLRMRWIGKHIPRADAKWMGSLLAQLSPDQIRDAFRAADYTPEQVDAYTEAVISRIQELNSL